MNYVVGFLFNLPKDMVVLIKKEKPSWQKGKLNGVGGKIEEGESPLEAMIREFKEETNVDIKDWIEFAEMNLNHTGEKVFFFTACELYQPLTSLTEEQVGWYHINKLDHQPIIPNLKWLIPLALDKDGVTVVIEDGPK